MSLPDLIAKLEAVESGTGLLSADVVLAAEPSGSFAVHAKTVRRSVFPTLVWRYHVPVTESLDAAVSLVERVLPGWWWTAGNCGLTSHASVGPDLKFIQEPDLSKYDEGFHADIRQPSTPALALCIALLKALQAKGEQG